MFFVISLFDCGVVLFVMLCGVWVCVLLRCSFSSYWKINFSQLQVQLMIWTSTLQIQNHGYFDDLEFIILFVGIFSLYAINLGVVSLFADPPFTFLVMLNMLLYLMCYQFEWVLFLWWSGLNHAPYIYYALSISTELSLQRQKLIIE